MRYLIEYKWGFNEPQVKESQEITTDDLEFTLDQIGRHRGNITFTKIEKL